MKPTPQEQLDAIDGMLDEWWGKDWASLPGGVQTTTTAERIENVITALKHPANKTAFHCVQLLNAVKHLRGHLAECDCPKTGLHKIHELDCVHSHADLLILHFQKELPETDAEIWMRVLNLLRALQKGARKSDKTGYVYAPVFPMEELFEVAAGNPAAITDAYAAMETLRGTVVKLQQLAGKLSSGGKAKREFNKGFRAAIELAVVDIKEVTNPMATDICAGLVLSFAAWLSSNELGLGATKEETARVLAEAADDFIERFRLQRAKVELE
jgi:hypothetical protein